MHHVYLQSICYFHFLVESVNPGNSLKRKVKIKQNIATMLQISFVRNGYK